MELCPHFHRLPEDSNINTENNLRLEHRMVKTDITEKLNRSSSYKDYQNWQ